MPETALACGGPWNIDSFEVILESMAVLKDLTCCTSTYYDISSCAAVIGVPIYRIPFETIENSLVS